jgi:hypothetical protein
MDSLDPKIGTDIRVQICSRFPACGKKTRFRWGFDRVTKCVLEVDTELTVGNLRNPHALETDRK